MGTLNALIELVGRTLSEWRSSGISGLAFNARNAALLTTALLAVIAATVLVWRVLRGRLPGRTAIALPAVLPLSVARLRSPVAFVRHAPFVLFLAGLPFFCLALADPYSSLSPGSEGTISLVDAKGTLHVNWDSGSTLGLVPDEDRWVVL